MNKKEITKSMLRVGVEVEINPKSDRTRTKLVSGLVGKILTSAEKHPHGIMVKLQSGETGRVKSLVDPAANKTIEPSFGEYPDDSIPVTETNRPINDILNDDEGHFLEFKESMLWSVKATPEQIKKSDSSELKRYGRDASKVIIAKSIAAFLNSDGGYLIIGIREIKSTSGANETIGIESEYSNLKDQCEDGYRRMIVDGIIKAYFPDFIFNGFNNYLRIVFQKVEGSTLCVLKVNKSDAKVFLSIKKEKLFLIRVDASNRQLENEAVVDYCVKRF